MSKIKLVTLIGLILVFSLAAMVNAQISPLPETFSPTLRFLEAPPFRPLGLPAIAPCTPIKLTLSPVEQQAVQNLVVGKWHVIRFCFPAQYAGQRLTWTTSNPDVALADGQASWGLVLGVSPGTAIITVTTTDGTFSYSFQVVVR